jgi:hypothetical protein
VTLVLLGAACAGSLTGCAADASSAPPATNGEPAAPYATEIVSFEPGSGAGFGQDELPHVVLGPPHGKGRAAGSLDVLSLGEGGSIVLGFGPKSIVDGDGPDFIVFENAFWAGADPAAVFAEPGEVSVSADGERWESFSCAAAGEGEGRFPGCAGWTPALGYDPASPTLDPAVTGGDAFDLAELGLVEARFVRVRDVSETGAPPTAGFDLDAIGVVNASDLEP